MARPGSLTLEGRCVPCPKCGVGFDGRMDAGGFFEQCDILEKTIVRDCQRKGKPLPKSDRIHQERATFARQWLSAGQPDIRIALGWIFAAQALLRAYRP